MVRYIVENTFALIFKNPFRYSAHALIDTPLIDTFSLIDTLFGGFVIPPNCYDFFDTFLCYFNC